MGEKNIGDYVKREKTESIDFWGKLSNVDEFFCECIEKSQIMEN